MNIDEIKWTQPCGCGGSADPVAEFQYSAGWLRVKKLADGTYAVTKYGHDKRLVSGPADMGEAEFAALIA